jgi:hypothetical protein
MLRHDFTAFAELARLIELKGRETAGTKAKVKSGYDGAERSTRIFSRKTQDHCRRLGWRYLRTVARYRPDWYAPAAAAVLAAARPDDLTEPHGREGATARCYLLHRVLLGGSQRFHFDGRRLVFRFKSAKAAKAPEGAREEAFAELWDRHPAAYVRVLANARLLDAHELAVRAVKERHPDLLQSAAVADLVRMLVAPYEPTVQFALDELERRFDPEQPDWNLVHSLLADPRPPAHGLGQQFLRRCVGLWTHDVERVLTFLLLPVAASRSVAAELLLAHPPADAELRRNLAEQVLARIRQPETVADTHLLLARIGRELLAAELDQLVTVPDLLALIAGGSAGAQALAGHLLARRPEAVAELGIERLTALAQHPLAAVRSSAHALLRAAADRLRTDPGPLFVLVESEWDDTRAVALELLRPAVDVSKLGLDGLMGLLDSNRVEVQDLGRESALAHFAALPAVELVDRLAQHPHPNMRRFALELASEHLPDTADALTGLERFFRTALLDLSPERKVKRRVVALLLERGLRDVPQARVAARVLGEAVRLNGRADFEDALAALTRLQLAHPTLESPVALAEAPA